MAYQKVYESQVCSSEPEVQCHDESEFTLVEFSYLCCRSCKENLLHVKTGLGDKIICYSCNLTYKSNNISPLVCSTRPPEFQRTESEDEQIA